MNKKAVKKLFIICIISVMISVPSACSKPEYLREQLETRDSGNIIEEDTYDRFSFVKKGDYRCAVNNKGLFYIPVGSNNISYYDYSTGKSSVWCSNIACGHSDKNCSSYVQEGFEYEYVEWFNGYVYKIEHDDNGIYLMRLKEDGSGQIRMADLTDGYPTGINIQFGRVYDGKMYYSVRKDVYQLDVNCVDLVTKDTVDHVFSLDSENISGDASLMYINDKYIYFPYFYKPDGDKKSERKILMFNRADKTMSEVENTYKISSCCANDDIYYFTEDNRLFRINDSGETQVHPRLFNRLPSNDYSISCNENYIVFMRRMPAPWLGQDSDIYIYDIRNDILKCVEEASVHTEAESASSAAAEVQSETIGSSGYVAGSKIKEFCILYGMSGRYAFVTGPQKDVMYLIDMAEGEAKKININIFQNKLPGQGH